MTNVSHKHCKENLNTRFIFNNFSFPENRVVYEIIWKNMLETDRPHLTLWAHAYWMLDTLGYKYTLRICNTLLFHCNSNFTKAPLCYVIRRLLVVFHFLISKIVLKLYFPLVIVN